MFVIIHYTECNQKLNSIKRLKTQDIVSCHYLINRKGKIFQLVKDKCVSWHAGKSKWKKFVNLNDKSIGIELVNKGHQYGYQNFTKMQIKSLIDLCLNLKRKYLIKKENFLGHSDIAPLRKIDPGERFPWRKLSSYSIGNWYSKSKKNIRVNSKKIDVLFFKNLQKIGYRYFKVQKRNVKDKKIITSFQQHYLPKNVTGRIDKKTYEISQFLALKS